MSVPQELQAWIAAARPEHSALLNGLHDLLMRTEPSFEVWFNPWRAPSYRKDGQVFCYLADFKNHVALGFYNGTQFPDPHGLVEGTGKRMRHIKVRELDDELGRKLADTVRASLAAGSEYRA